MLMSWVSVKLSTRSDRFSCSVLMDTEFTYLHDNSEYKGVGWKNRKNLDLKIRAIILDLESKLVILVMKSSDRGV